MTYAMKTAPAFDTTFEQRLAKLDLTRVMEKVAVETGMESSDLIAAEDLYRKFLTIKYKNPTLELAPPVIVDHVWDVHVMFTKQYRNDCDMLFGQFIDHNPHVESDGWDVTPAFAATQRLFQSEFDINFTRTGLRAEYVQAAWCN